MTEFKDNYEEIFKRLRDFVLIHRGHALNLDNKRSKLALQIIFSVDKQIW